MAPSIYLTYNMVKENFFEVAASRFVSQNFNYADTQVLSKSAVTEHGKRIIRVSLVGAEIPKDSIAVAQARLPQYGSSRVWAKSSGYKYFEQCDV